MASSLNDYDPDLSGDIVQATKAARKLQTTYDQSNSSQYLTPKQQGQAAAPVTPPAGPVARAAQQLPTASASSAAPAASLYDIRPTGSAGLNGQTSFDQSNTPSQYLRNSGNPSVPLAVPVAPASNQASSLDSFRGTGIGAGAQGGQIAVSQGADGVPSFSNSNAAQQQAASLGSIPVRAAIGPTWSDDPSASLASLGDAGNLGNGRGTFSQAQAGDAALATGRFNRASQLRQGYADQDRLSAALNANDRANSLTIVPDSSRTLSWAEQHQADRNLQTDALARQGRLEDISAASANLNGGIDRQGAQQQLRQASRLEDLQVAATGPNATQQARAAYQQAMDPTGEKALARQAQQASIDKTVAETRKTNADANGNSPQAQLTRLNVEKTQRELDQQPRDVERTQQSQLATFDQALGSVDSLLGTKVNPKNPNGPRLDEDPGLVKALGYLDGSVPTVAGTNAADFEARLDTLKAQTFLPQVAALKGTGALSDAEGKKLSDSVGALSTKMSEDAFRKSLGEVRSSLAAARDRAEKATGGRPAAPKAQQVDHSALWGG